MLIPLKVRNFAGGDNTGNRPSVIYRIQQRQKNKEIIVNPKHRFTQQTITSAVKNKLNGGHSIKGGVKDNMVRLSEAGNVVRQVDTFFVRLPVAVVLIRVYYNTFSFVVA